MVSRFNIVLLQEKSEGADPQTSLLSTFLPFVGHRATMTDCLPIRFVSRWRRRRRRVERCSRARNRAEGERARDLTQQYRVNHQVGYYILLTFNSLFLGLRNSGWAAANLAELAWHAGNMVEISI